MEPDFWHQRWGENKIGFHQKNINSRLKTYWPSLDIAAGSQVFVPLCGKSLDMLWFAEQGYQVLGIELSEIACEQFFLENNLEFTRQQLGDFSHFRSEQIHLIAGDFFALGPRDLSNVKGVYDRAALVALPEAMRRRYASHLAMILPGGCKIQLITMEYDELKMKGPPFSVTEAEVNALYDQHFSIRLIGSSSGPDIVGNLRERGLDTLEEKVFELIRTDI